MPASGRMFLRSHQRHKDGKQHTYWSLVETVRTADGPRQRRLCYLDDSTLVRAAELKPCCGNHDRSFLLWCSPSVAMRRGRRSRSLPARTFWRSERDIGEHSAVKEILGL